MGTAFYVSGKSELISQSLVGYKISKHQILMNRFCIYCTHVIITNLICLLVAFDILLLLTSVQARVIGS